MSTWLSDLRKKDPKLADAYRVVGNQPVWALRNMVRALSRLTLLNTVEDRQRLKAAKYIIRHYGKAKRQLQKQHG